MCGIAAKPSWESCRLLVEADLAQFKADLALKPGLMMRPPKRPRHKRSRTKDISSST
jgi:hypothetical protein